jgi:hypothetical protein
MAGRYFIPMSYALLSTCPPTLCGLATFAAALAQLSRPGASLLAAEGTGASA